MHTGTTARAPHKPLIAGRGHPLTREISTMSKTLGIIGSGLVGGATARLAVDAGYNVVLSNSRGPDSLAELVKGLGPLARAGTVEEAIEAGDIVAIPLPIAAYESLPAEKLAGK